MPIAIAAKILCKDMVQSAFHASAAVSAHSPNIQNHVGFFSSASFDHVNSNVDAKSMIKKISGSFQHHIPPKSSIQIDKQPHELCSTRYNKLEQTIT
jgi:hypothetical protein